MSQQELQRLKVVENAVEGRLSVAEAAVLLGVGERQVKRLKGNFDPANAEWVHHGNRGRQPANAIATEVRERVIELAVGKYAGFNDSHLHEELTREEGLSLSRASVQRILREANIRSPQRRHPPKYRSRRERRAQSSRLNRGDKVAERQPPSGPPSRNQPQGSYREHSLASVLANLAAAAAAQYKCGSKSPFNVKQMPPGRTWIGVESKPPENL